MELLLFFWTLFYINLFTIGGGFAMIPLLQAEIVNHHHWLTQTEFMESIAVGQMTPGPLTIMNAFIGFKIFGFWGATGAIFSTYIPSLLIATLMAHYYHQVKNSSLIISGMNAVKPVVIGLIAAAGITIGLHSLADNITTVIAIAGFLLMVYTKMDPSIIIIASGILGAMFL